MTKPCWMSPVLENRCECLEQQEQSLAPSPFTSLGMAHVHHTGHIHAKLPRQGQDALWVGPGHPKGILPFLGRVSGRIQAYYPRSMRAHDTCKLLRQGTPGPCQDHDAMLWRR
jgi:hypothetical protein